MRRFTFFLITLFVAYPVFATNYYYDFRDEAYSACQSDISSSAGNAQGWSVRCEDRYQVNSYALQYDQGNINYWITENQYFYSNACPAGAEWDIDQNDCVFVCPEGQIYNETTQQCEINNPCPDAGVIETFEQTVLCAAFTTTYTNQSMGTITKAVSGGYCTYTRVPGEAPSDCYIVENADVEMPSELYGVSSQICDATFCKIRYSSDHNFLQAKPSATTTPANTAPSARKNDTLKSSTTTTTEPTTTTVNPDNSTTVDTSTTTIIVTDDGTVLKRTPDGWHVVSWDGHVKSKTSATSTTTRTDNTKTLISTDTTTETDTAITSFDISSNNAPTISFTPSTTTTTTETHTTEYDSNNNPTSSTSNTDKSTSSNDSSSSGPSVNDTNLSPGDISPNDISSPSSEPPPEIDLSSVESNTANTVSKLSESNSLLDQIQQNQIDGNDILNSLLGAPEDYDSATFGTQLDGVASNISNEAVSALNSFTDPFSGLSHMDIAEWLPDLPISQCTGVIDTTIFGKQFYLSPCEKLAPLREVLAWVFSVLAIFSVIKLVFVVGYEHQS